MNFVAPVLLFHYSAALAAVHLAQRLMMKEMLNVLSYLP